MKHIRVRLFALVLICIGAGLVCVNWYQLKTENKYSFKIAAFAPLCVVGGFFLIFFPTKVGKPVTMLDKILAIVVFGIGLFAGLVNWFLMDPGFFGR